MRRTPIFILLCLAARAALVPSLNIEELIGQSEVIAHGRVVRSWSAWDSAHKYIWTHHSIEVIDSIRGTGAVVASEPGGELDGMGMKFSGSVNYAAGEEVVVFLYRTPIGYLRATGFGQGKYTVTREMRVRRDLKGLDLLKRDRSFSQLDGSTLADFKARVRETIRTGNRR